MKAKEQSLVAEIYRFGDRTSIRGIPRILHNDNRPLQVLWAVAVVIAATITAYQMSAVVIKYLGFPADVVVHHEEANPKFPDVTICKTNPYSHHWDNVPSEPTIDEYFSFAEHLVESINSSSLNGWSLPSNFDSHRQDIVTFLRSPGGYFSNVLVPVGQYELPSSFGNMVSDLSYYSWSLQDYNGDPEFSQLSTVKLVVNPDYQICYQFHVPETRATDVRAMAGIFYTDDFTTTSIKHFDTHLRVSESTGVAVIVHAQGTFPDPLQAVNAGPGQEATILVYASVSERLGTPYDNCENIGYLTQSGQYEPGANRYTVDACYDLCVQRYVMAQCNCFDGSLTFTPVEIQMKLSMCGYMNMSRGQQPTRDQVESGLRQLVCYFGAIQDILSGAARLDCRCPTPCSEYVYETSVSSASWPHRSFQLAFYDDFIAGKPIDRENFNVYADIERSNLTTAEKLDRLDSVHLIEKNFLRLKILFKDRGLDTLNSTAAITWDGLASNIGGSLSLWIGVTVMTFFELVELIYRLTKFVVFRGETNLAPSPSVNVATETDSSATESYPTFDMSVSDTRPTRTAILSCFNG